MSNPEVSMHNEVTLGEVSLTVYLALAMNTWLVKSTTASQDRWVMWASWGLEREDGSRAGGAGVVVAVMVMVDCFYDDVVMKSP